eukprot:362930-Chlamydomonas_euryale.AAC.6
MGADQQHTMQPAISVGQQHAMKHALRVGHQSTMQYEGSAGQQDFMQPAGTARQQRVPCNMPCVMGNSIPHILTGLQVAIHHAAFWECWAAAHHAA